MSRPAPVRAKKVTKAYNVADGCIDTFIPAPDEGEARFDPEDIMHAFVEVELLLL